MDLVEAETRVVAGAEWLDANGPEGWMGKISLAYLNVNSPWMCVLGQVYEENPEGAVGFFYAVKNMLGENKAALLGFNSDALLSIERWHDMVLLTEVWSRYIAVKREELALAA